jgi:PAS domain S-box-containing protein
MQNKPRKSNENNFVTLLNFIIDPAVIVDEKGHLLLVNNALEEMTGLSKKEIIDKAFFELNLLPPKSKEIILENLKKRMQGLPVEPYEINFTDKTGKVRYVEIKAKKIDYAGQPADLVMFHDITRRKENARRLKEYSEKMEALVNEKVKEIKENEEKYRELTESISDVFFAMDKNLRYIYWNKASENLTGIPAKDAIGKHLAEIFPDIKETKVEQFYKKVLRTKQSQSFLNKYRVRDRDFVFEISAYPTMNGVSVFVRDITEHKRMEEALQESEEKFKNLAEQSPNMVFVNKKGRVVYANKKAEEIMGYSKEEFYSPHFNFLCLIAPESREQINSIYEQHLKSSKDVAPLEYRLVTKYGRILDAILTSRLITYEGDKAILGTVIDITERKQLEEDLRSSEEMFRAISTSAMDAIILINNTSKITYWNPAAERIFGYTNEEAVGKQLDNLIIPQKHRELHLKSVIKAVKNGEIHENSIAFKAIRKNGTEIPIDLSISMLKIKDKTHMLGIIRDVSEHKKMENELKHERDMLEAVTENIGAGLAIISKDYRILWANKLLKQINGDCEGKMCYSTFNRLTDICPDCGVKKVFESNATFDAHEFAFTDDKGNTQWIELIVTPIKDRDGTVVAALELAVNITERKIMQNKLAEYSQKLEKLVEKRTEQLKQTQAKLVKSERLATIGELAAMVGHDLRNPLTGIMGAAYYLKAKHGTAVGVKGKEMLEIIENAINYSNKIINDLLEYSRDLKLKLTATTPKAMLQSALSLLEVPEKIQVVDVTKDKPAVKVDTEKIRKGFINIIQNAFDAMPEGGTLTIKSRKVKGKLEIAFKDTGTGMSEENLSKLKKGVPLFTTKAKGMGFGLPICRRLVEAHGGKLSVKSMAGKGTTVTVTIPVNPEPVDEGEEKWILSESMLSAITSAQRAP